MTYDITTLTQLREAASAVLAGIEVGDTPVVLALSGDLGAGKTAFTKELASLLGIAETVTSPTFVVMKQYELSEGARFDTLVHIDAYRFEDAGEAGPLRLNELFEMPRTLVCVEWPEKLDGVLPSTAVKIQFTLENDGTRTLAVE